MIKFVKFTCHIISYTFVDPLRAVKTVLLKKIMGSSGIHLVFKII